jgi:hypothetical protein
MARQLPPEIAVHELYDGVRFRLPRRPMGRWNLVGLVPLVLGAFVASWPALGILFFLSVGAGKNPDALPFIVLGPLAVFGPICLPVGGFFAFTGLCLLVGHNEVVVRNGRLSVVERAGWLRWTYRRRLDQVRGFRVTGEHTTCGPTAGPVTILARLTRLYVDCTRGKPLGVCWLYPREWLLPLADELASRCQMEATYRGLEPPAPVAVTEEAPSPAEVLERPKQPSNSDALVRQGRDELAIVLPPVGLRRGGGTFLLFFTILWNSFVLLFTVFFLPAALRGEVVNEDTGKPASAWVALVLVPFWLFGVGALLVLLQKGRRRAVLTVEAGELTIQEISPLSNRLHTWRRSELAGVRVVSELVVADETPESWKIELCVEPREGPPVRLLGHRPKAELEWIATLLRQALHLS